MTITSSLMLDRFDPVKPTFFKTDWSAGEMSWILIQPVDDIESTKATRGLLNSDEYTFDLGKDGARICPVRFGSRVYTEFERQYHLFVGEVVSGRLVISQNRH